MAETSPQGTEVPLPDLPNLFVSRFHARTFALKLGAVILALILLHVAAMTWYWGENSPEWLKSYMVGFFDLDEEQSFGTYYSSLVLLLIGRLLWKHAKYVRHHGDRMHAWWLVLALGFHFLSLDEIIGVHESLNEHLKRQGELASTGRWTSAGFVAACVVGVTFLPFLWRLRWRTAVWFVVGGAIYLLGAIGVEKWTDVYETTGRLNTLEYNLWTCVEEALEMIGPVIFLHAFLAHVSGHVRGTVTAACKLET